MKINRYIVTVLLCALSLCAWSQDYARLSERTILGTARYMGMSGAMSAVGGDPSAALDNPAGLGLYRRAEVLLSGGMTIDQMRQTGTANASLRRYFVFPQASLVFSVPTFNSSGVQFHNFMLSYQRLHSFRRTYVASAEGSRSLGALLTTADVNWDIPFCSDRYSAYDALSLQESGYVDQYSFHYAMNIAEQWYVGFGLQMQSFAWSSDAQFEETFAAQEGRGQTWFNRNTTTLLFNGVSCNFAAGLIYRPLSWLRLGFGIQTPSVGSKRMYSTGKLAAQTDSLRYSYAPDINDMDKGFHMPLKTSTSVAFQIGAYAMIALQYDYAHASYKYDTHSLRAGVEVIPVLGMYINAGYAYESAFRKTFDPVPMDKTFDRQDTYYLQPNWSQYASVALGYRGSFMMIQAAYQYHWQNINLCAHEAADPYKDINTDTHRIVITIGWHQN